jgi:energy-coupling factor transporter transmembrane protein EcfT
MIYDGRMQTPQTYYPRESPVHRMDARVKLALVLVYSIALFVAGTWPSLGALAVALAVVELVHIAEDLFFLRALPGPALLAALPQLLWTLCWVPVVYGIFSRAFDRVGGDRLS